MRSSDNARLNNSSKADPFSNNFKSLLARTGANLLGAYALRQYPRRIQPKKSKRGFLSKHMSELPYQQHSGTSREAALSMEQDARTLRQQVLDYIREQGVNGATDEEIQDALHMNPSTQRPRRVELMKMGKITINGTRKTKSGRLASVWIY